MTQGVSADTNSVLQGSILRILDSKSDVDIDILNHSDAPVLSDFLSQQSRETAAATEEAVRVVVQALEVCNALYSKDDID